MRIVLTRHGKPLMDRARWLGANAFQTYMERYRDSGLDPESPPPDSLRKLIKGAERVYTSDLKRAIESARALAPGAEIASDAIFTEAPMASPKIPGLKLKVPAWAVLSRVVWHGGYTPRMESYWHAKHRAQRAMHVLVDHAKRDGLVVLVGHGYFNAILGRLLRLHGWEREGSHRADFWNTVVYEFALPEVAKRRTRRLRSGRGRSSRALADLPT